MLSRLDLLKKALKFIMRQLHNGDHLTIVFNNDSNKKFKISKDTEKDAETLDKFLVEANGTLFRPGLKEAGKIFDKEGVDDKYVCFIILLSDGLDKSAFMVKSPDANKAALRGFMVKYPVHTFGLGKDHDPSALLYIANKSKGTYSSITENISSMLIEALAVCLGGITNIVAVDTVIKITAHDYREAKMKTTITRVEEYGSILSDIPIGILYAGEVKDLVVHFRVTIGKFKQATNHYGPLSAHGECKMFDAKNKVIRGESIEPLKPMFPVYALSRLPEAERHLLPFPVVKQQMIRINVLSFLDNFQKYYNQEVKNRAGRAGSKEDGKWAVETIAGSKLMDLWEEFKEKNETWKNAQEIGLDVERFGNDIEAMERGLSRGLGMGCVYSWVSSYQMQRATTTGLPATAFLTPAMKKMVEEAQKTPSSAAGNTDPAVPPGDAYIWKRATQLLGGQSSK